MISQFNYINKERYDDTFPNSYLEKLESNHTISTHANKRNMENN